MRRKIVTGPQDLHQGGSAFPLSRFISHIQLTNISFPYKDIGEGIPGLMSIRQHIPIQTR